MKRRQETIVEHDNLLALANEEFLFVGFEAGASSGSAGTHCPDSVPGSLLGLADLVESLEAYSPVRLEVGGEATEVDCEVSALGKV